MSTPERFKTIVLVVCAKDDYVCGYFAFGPDSQMLRVVSKNSRKSLIILYSTWCAIVGAKIDFKLNF